MGKQQRCVWRGGGTRHRRRRRPKQEQQCGAIVRTPPAAGRLGAVP